MIIYYLTPTSTRKKKKFFKNQMLTWISSDRIDLKYKFQW